MPPPLTRPVALAIGTRLAIVPALLMLLAAPLIDLPAAYRLLSAMPSGLNSLVIAHAYGLDMEITAEAVDLVDRDRRRRCPSLVGVLMLHHVGIEIDPGDVERAVEFFALLGFEAGRAAAGPG